MTVLADDSFGWWQLWPVTALAGDSFDQWWFWPATALTSDSFGRWQLRPVTASTGCGGHNELCFDGATEESLVSTCSVRFRGRAAAVINGLPGLPTNAKYFWQWISFTPGYEMSCPGKMVGKWLLDIHFPTWVQTYIPGLKLTVLGMLGGENGRPTNVKKIKWFPKGTVL
jgi:hypothetical protein